MIVTVCARVRLQASWGTHFTRFQKFLKSLEMKCVPLLPRTKGKRDRHLFPYQIQKKVPGPLSGSPAEPPAPGVSLNAQERSTIDT